jgi:hypothetical protein
MPKQKTSRSHTKRKKTAAKKTAVKKTAREKPAKSKRAEKKPVAKKHAGKEKKVKLQPARKTAAAKSHAAPKKKAVGKSKASASATVAAKSAGAVRKRVATESQIYDTDAATLQERKSRSAGQAGDLQGLSEHEGADSESVDQLLEEGNAFEADAVSGVEAADDADEQEVRTHEVPEDDVPGEYLDEE